jgi:hypothetical protein
VAADTRRAGVPGATEMLNPDFRDMSSAFVEHEVDDLVVGAYALSYRGLPRATGEIDPWVRSSAENASRVRAAVEPDRSACTGLGKVM